MNYSLINKCYTRGDLMIGKIYKTKLQWKTNDFFTVDFLHSLHKIVWIFKAGKSIAFAFTASFISNHLKFETKIKKVKEKWRNFSQITIHLQMKNNFWTLPIRDKGATRKQTALHFNLEWNTAYNMLGLAVVDFNSMILVLISTYSSSLKFIYALFLKCHGLIGFQTLAYGC